MRVLANISGSSSIKGRGNDVIHDRHYWGDNAGGSSIIAANENRIFVAPVGTGDVNISTGAAVTKKEADTSLEGQGGSIPNGESFVIYAVGVNVKCSNIQATTPFTNNAVTSINVTPLYRVSPLPLIDAIMSQGILEIYRNANQLIERGNFPEYPCEFGQNVMAGGGSASVPALAGGNQNAYVVSPLHYIESAGFQFRALPVYNVLRALDEFYGIAQFSRAIDLASTLLCGYIDYYLVGQVNLDFTAPQAYANLY